MSEFQNVHIIRGLLQKSNYSSGSELHELKGNPYFWRLWFIYIYILSLKIIFLWLDTTPMSVCGCSVEVKIWKMEILPKCNVTFFIVFSRMWLIKCCSPEAARAEGLTVLESSLRALLHMCVPHRWRSSGANSSEIV